MPPGDAARIHRHARQLVERSRSAGETRIRLRVGTIRDDMGLNYPDAVADICQVLETDKFQYEARVTLLGRTKRPIWGADTVFSFSV